MADATFIDLHPIIDSANTNANAKLRGYDLGSSTYMLAAGPGGTTVSITPTLTATPDYDATDGAGGIQTVALVNAGSGRPTKLRSVTVVDKGGQAPAFTLLLFKATPASGTYTDNATLVLSAGDVGNLVGAVKVLAADYITPSSGIKAVTYSDINLNLPINATSLFALILVDATWNAGSTSDLTITFGFDFI